MATIIKTADVMIGINVGFRELLRRPVAQYNLDGDLIAVYDSIYQAEKVTCIKHISECVNHKRNTAGGYVWRIKGE